MINLVNGYSKFRQEVYPIHKHLFAGLDSGQSPETLIISCSDSRVDVNWVTQAKPGDIFHVRNAGNLVPPVDTGERAAAGAIEFALTQLPIRDMVVCGHSDCGAMKGLQAGIGDEDDSAVAGWLRHAAASTPDASELDLDALIKANIIRQLESLREHPLVAEGEARGELHLWGWMYDIGTSEIFQLDESTGGFSALETFAPVA